MRITPRTFVALALPVAAFLALSVPSGEAETDLAVSWPTEPLSGSLGATQTLSAEAIDSALSYFATTTTTTTTTTAVPHTHAPARTPPPVTDSPAEITAIIRKHFGDTEHLFRQAMAIVNCESQFNPSATSDTNDHGLFQINAGVPGWPRGWQDRFHEVIGVPFFDGVYNPDLNARFARFLFDANGGWGDWSCRYVL